MPAFSSLKLAVLPGSRFHEPKRFPTGDTQVGYDIPAAIERLGAEPHRETKDVLLVPGERFVYHIEIHRVEVYRLSI